MWTIASLTRDGTLGRSFRYLGNACLNRIRLQIVKHENDYWYFSGQLMGRKVFWPEWNEGLWWQTFDKYAFWCEISSVSILHCLFKRLSETTFFSASALWNPMWMNEYNITQIPFLTIPNTARPTTYLNQSMSAIGNSECGSDLWNVPDIHSGVVTRFLNKTSLKIRMVDGPGTIKEAGHIGSWIRYGIGSRNGCRFRSNGVLEQTRCQQRIHWY